MRQHSPHDRIELSIFLYTAAGAVLGSSVNAFVLLSGLYRPEVSPWVILGVGAVAVTFLAFEGYALLPDEQTLENASKGETSDD
jgi:hypothetical protein